MSTSSLNIQTEREVRYEQKCQKRRIIQQTSDRIGRAEKRDAMSNEISTDVANEISMISRTTRVMPRRNNKSSPSYFS
jgi:hypothetical protein|tara:strand:- start:34 stop:267 length:234 start_codon:yes stop_codon:yes gene_type:complete